MATTTNDIRLSSAAGWTLLSAGTTTAMTIQAPVGQVDVYVGAAAPTDMSIRGLSVRQTGLSLTGLVAGTDNVYGRCKGANATLVEYADLVVIRN